MQKQKRWILNVVKTLLVPAIVFLVVEIICLAFAGRHLFMTKLDLMNYLRTMCISFFAALALSFNLNSGGRFDLSLGGQRLVAAIIGGNIALRLGLGSLGVILFSVLFGALAGLLVGVIYARFRIQAMVLGIAMALIFECACFTFSLAGIQMYGVADVERLSQVGYPLAAALIVITVVTVIMRYTQFGYNMRAASGSEVISQKAGLSLTKVTLGCYALGGGVIALSGIFDAAYKGKMMPVLGLGSSSAVMANCFPVFLGRTMSQWSNAPIGIFFATIAVKFFTTGMSVIKVSASGQQVCELLLFLVFLVYSANQDFFKRQKDKAARIAETLRRQQRQITSV